MKAERIQYVPLTKSIPEFNKRDNTVYTCSLGYSPQKGLIRVYPLPTNGISKWIVYEIPIEKNKRDSRLESWKLASNSRHEDFQNIENDVYNSKIKQANKYDFLNNLIPYIYNSISEMNKNRVSIGLIKSDSFRLYWETNKNYVNTDQKSLFSDVDIPSINLITKDGKSKESRIFFKDADGKHNLQYNEWGVYESYRKFGLEVDSFRYLKPSNNTYILLGNMNAHRSSWLALGIVPIYLQYKLF